MYGKDDADEIFSAPINFAAILILGASMPAFPMPSFDRALLRRIDPIGCLLSISWAIPLVFALQEGGASFSWTSGAILGPSIGGVAAATIFITWESWLGRRTLDTILPMRLFRDPVVVLVFMSVSFPAHPRLISQSIISRIGDFFPSEMLTYI